MANLGTRLDANQWLNANDPLTAANGIAYLVMQNDGNLVLYSQFGQAFWASSTDGTAADRAVMQADGNFVVYDATNHPYWATGTDGNPGAYLVLQDDANLVLYSIRHEALWASDVFAVCVDSTLGDLCLVSRYLRSPEEEQGGVRRTEGQQREQRVLLRQMAGELERRARALAIPPKRLAQR